MASQWYVLRSKPHKERVLCRQLQDRGIDVFYPSVGLPVNHSRAQKIKPIFPGYLFVKIDLGIFGLSTFQWMPYSTGIVCFGEKPACVPDSLIQAIRRRLDPINSAEEMLESVMTHSKVIKDQKMAATYETIFNLCLPESDRIRAFLRLLEQMNISPN